MHNALQAAAGRLFIHDVAPRDGFQNESGFIPTERKIELIDALSATGLAKIEVTSFTSPKAIPSLADAEAVMKGIARAPGVRYTALVPNERGCERALACGVDEINLVMSVSLSHSLANLRRTPETSIRDFARIVRQAESRASIACSLSTAFGCPFEGEVAPGPVMTAIEQLVDIGIDAIVLCDTTGMAHPRQVYEVFTRVGTRWPALALTAHFHDTRGMGLANVLAALQAGVVRFDASLGGLGGCPYAPGADGNVCTEDLVHMLALMGYDTGVDLSGLVRAASLLAQMIDHPLSSRLLRAGPSSRRYPLPEAARHPG
ncbi:Hydroxymethylglutaryl-CoA lyase YngG [Pigmentiphaga humi]|uniref:Hydroxymethylglutaryl-CoA lyase YngG n=1 Tax=Pigmentiphaga humi TaxID=2478468 RepID=A0A3P4B3H3_9BURK|nr:hydroxymethylglutaryl-CoA lyase [Pigmentiphaga humi]VCU70178.1 Hydroxymethylglutaryl-CoA lyase YngG [Pigmentiphaga humi]